MRFTTMTAKYPGTCKRCRQPIRPGETIRYGGKGLTYHLAAKCSQSQPDSPSEPVRMTPDLAESIRQTFTDLLAQPVSLVDLVADTEPQPAIWYDYTNQAWVENGKYTPCGHPKPCTVCYGTRHAGETADPALCQDRHPIVETAKDHFRAATPQPVRQTIDADLF